MVDIEKLEKLMAQATPGPWFCKSVPGLGGGRHNRPHIFADGVCLPVASLSVIKGEEDAAYIVAACNSLPDLIAENRALQERAQMRQELVEQYEKDIARLRQKVRELETQRDYLLDKVVIEDNTDDIDYCPIPVDYPCSYRSKCGWGCETGSREQRKGCWIKALEEVIVT